MYLYQTSYKDIILIVCAENEYQAKSICPNGQIGPNPYSFKNWPLRGINCKKLSRANKCIHIGLVTILKWNK